MTPSNQVVRYNDGETYYEARSQTMNLVGAAITSGGVNVRTYAPLYMY
jgi:hypothetical protein